MDLSDNSIKLYCNILNHCTKQHIYMQQSQCESYDPNIIMIMIISWLWHYSPMDSSTLIPTISWPFAIKFAYMFADFLLRWFVRTAYRFHFSLSRVCTYSMKFAYMRGYNGGFFLHKSKKLQLVPRKKKWSWPCTCIKSIMKVFDNYVLTWPNALGMGLTQFHCSSTSLFPSVSLSSHFHYLTLYQLLCNLSLYSLVDTKK